MVCRVICFYTKHVDIFELLMKNHGETMCFLMACTSCHHVFRIEETYQQLDVFEFGPLWS